MHCPHNIQFSTIMWTTLQCITNGPIGIAKTYHSWQYPPFRLVLPSDCGYCMQSWGRQCIIFMTLLGHSKNTPQLLLYCTLTWSLYTTVYIFYGWSICDLFYFILFWPSNFFDSHRNWTLAPVLEDLAAHHNLSISSLGCINYLSHWSITGNLQLSTLHCGDTNLRVGPMICCCVDSSDSSETYLIEV
jgi:hypothetical protein